MKIIAKTNVLPEIDGYSRARVKDLVAALALHNSEITLSTFPLGFPDLGA